MYNVLGGATRRALIFSMVVLLAYLALTYNAEARDGRDVCAETCDKCHGVLMDQSSWYRGPTVGDAVRLAVITPRGPNLSNVFGRPVGIMEGHSYSRGMKAFAQTGAVWDRETLGSFLTISRKFVKGTFMILKLNDDDRKLVLDYLEQAAPYTP